MGRNTSDILFLKNIVWNCNVVYSTSYIHVHKFYEFSIEKKEKSHMGLSVVSREGAALV